MEVEEAIKKINYYINLDSIDDLGPVIELIKELDKYRQMWEEVSKGYGRGIKDFSDIKQKYFPEEAKKGGVVL